MESLEDGGAESLMIVEVSRISDLEVREVASK
jgi:hypothetical protein